MKTKASDLVTTAKLRAMAKQLGIPYVDAISADNKYAEGIHIWKIGNDICFKTLNDSKQVYVTKFVHGLHEIGLTVKTTMSILGAVTGVYTIVVMNEVTK